MGKNGGKINNNFKANGASQVADKRNKSIGQREVIYTQQRRRLTLLSGLATLERPWRAGAGCVTPPT